MGVKGTLDQCSQLRDIVPLADIWQCLETL